MYSNKCIFYIIIVDIPYDGNSHPEGYPLSHIWFFGLDPGDTTFASGDVFTLQGAPVNGSDDVFTFKVDGISETAARAEMSDIKVVPDPYLGWADYGGNNKYIRKLQFINLPENCSIRIYTLGGDLVRTLEHDGGAIDNEAGSANWDMLSGDGLAIASGIYIFHVESDYGNRIGRFAVIM